MNNKITNTNYIRQSELPEISQRIIDKMTNNPAFPNPPAALADLAKALPEYQAALSKALGRDKEMVSAKNDKKAVILSLLEELAEYVTVTSKGDRTVMLSSGFIVPDDSVNSSPSTPSIERLEVDISQPGSATVRIRNKTGVIAYVHEYATETPGPETAWVSIGSSQGTYTFEGLTSDQRYWFRVVAIGTNGQRGYSPVVSRVIQ